ncbi:MAG TPA: ABC transporter permease [Gemmatimonadaceae bacterium]|jgi:putative ABC transport system permease protein|nr:ABC transporter permease [Gemmatimonadaceae bacterium]
MTPLPFRLLERFLSSATADAIIGDLTERSVTGLRLWRETLAALWHLRDRSPRPVGLMSSFLSDLRLAVRLLGRAPTFTAAAVLTLGIAIGAATAIFSVANPVVLQPLPYRDPDRVVVVWEREADGGRSNLGFTTFRDYVDRATTLESAAAVGTWQPTLMEGNESERLSGLRVSASYFRTLGVQPAIGRDFRADEDRPERPRPVILSHALWQRRFGGDRGVVGKPIRIGSAEMTVIGVMPAGFDDVVQPDAQIWRVLGYGLTEPFACRTCRHLRMVARLEERVSVERAERELTRIHGAVVADHQKDYASVGTQVVPLQDEVTREYRPAIVALGAAVVLMLVIAIANVANLQLARLVRRDEEFAIRIALGASAPRITRQLLTEALVIAVLGGLAGVAIAALAIPALVRQLPPELPRLSAIDLDLAALGAVGAVVLTLALVVGLVPRRARRAENIADGLRSGRRLTGTRHAAVRAGLVVTELAFALVLLVGAGLLAQSVVRLLNVDKGFDANNLLTMEINSIGPRYEDDESVWRYHDQVREAVRTLPGVVGVGVVNQLPLGGNRDDYGVYAQDKPNAATEDVPYGSRYVVSADYLNTMRIRVLQGRAFTEAEERDTANMVVLVSQALAAKLWPGQSALGKRIRMGGVERPFRTVIGVTANVRHSGLDATETMQFYVPERQWFFSDPQEVLVVRTRGDPGAMAGMVRQAILRIDPAQPLVKIASMDQVVAASTAQRRLALTLFACFAIAAVLLAVAGIYGVLAGNVAERTREIGLRAALGATPSNILALVVGQGARLAVAGLALGLFGAFALTRSLRALLFGVGPHDPMTVVGATTLLLVTTLVACLIPAKRALRVDPSEAFRAD